MSKILLCTECRFEIPLGAARCGHCGIIQSNWKRFVLRWGGLGSAFLLIVPIWQIAISSSNFINYEVSYSLNSTCDNGFIEFEVFNQEPKYPIIFTLEEVVEDAWTERYLELYGDRNVVILPGQIGTFQAKVAQNSETATENSGYTISFSVSQFPRNENSLVHAEGAYHCAWENSDTL